MKQTLVLITGMMCDERLWMEQIDSKDLKEKFLLVTPSRESLKKPSISQMAKSILEEVKEQKFFVMGLSMGGIILMEIYRQAPHRVLGVVLADTNHKAETKERQEQRFEDLKLLEKIGLKKYVMTQLKPKYLAEKTEKTKIYPLVLEMAESLGEEVFRLQSFALKDRRDYTETIRSMDCPSLIICGEEDKLCPVERHHQMHDLIPKSSLKILPQAGHLSCLEQPKNFNQTVLDHFQL